MSKFDLFRKITFRHYQTSYSTMDFIYPPHFCWDKFNNDDFIKSNFISGNYTLYVHFPFCESRCKFCCLYSVACRNEKMYQKYIDLLIKELKLYTDRINIESFQNVHFGGGSPTLFHFEKLFKIINRRKVLGQVNIEATPDSLDKDKIKLLKDCGVERIMIGVQSFDPRVLKRADRPQNNDNFFKVFSLVRKIGIPIINLTLIYGLPGQTIKSFLDDLKTIIKLKPESIHTYGYMNTPTTNFYREGYCRSQKVEELKGRMIAKGEKILEKAGYILNGNDYVLNGDPGFRNQTSLRANKSKGHMALGISSIGVFYAENNRGVLIKKINTNSYTRYKKAIENREFPIEKYFKLDKEERARAALIMAYRGEALTKDGFLSGEKKELIKRYSSAFNYLKRKGLIKKNKDGSITFAPEDSIIYSKIFYSPKVLNRCRELVKDIKISEIPDLKF